MFSYSMLIYVNILLSTIVWTLDGEDGIMQRLLDALCLKFIAVYQVIYLNWLR